MINLFLNALFAFTICVSAGGFVALIFALISSTRGRNDMYKVLEDEVGYGKE